MELLIKSPQASLGKVMLDFNNSFPLLFVRFYKSNEFSLPNRHPYSTKINTLTNLPLSLSLNGNETIDQANQLLSETFKVHVEMVYYPKDKETAYRFVSDELKLTLTEAMERGIKDGWLDAKAVEKRESSQ